MVLGYQDGGHYDVPNCGLSILAWPHFGGGLQHTWLLIASLRAVGVVVGGVKRAGWRWPKIRLSRLRRAARGHAAPPFPKIFVIVRAVTNHPVAAVWVRLRTAAQTVVGPNAARKTGNGDAVFLYFFLAAVSDRQGLSDGYRLTREWPSELFR